MRGEAWVECILQSGGEVKPGSATGRIEYIIMSKRRQVGNLVVKMGLMQVTAQLHYGC